MGDGRVGDRYAIDGGLDGKRRLDLLAEAMRPTTLALLGRVGLAKGHRCLDLGCGGGHVAIDMARVAGPGGRVVGVDFDASVVELARADAAEAGVDCEFHGLPRGGRRGRGALSTSATRASCSRTSPTRASCRRG